MSNFGFEDWIDAQLRNVPVPGDLLARLAETGAEAAPSEEPVRVDNEADSRLDNMLRCVPVPSTLESRLRRIGRQPRPMPVWYQMGLASSVLIVVGLGGTGAVGLMTGAFAPEPATVADTSAESRATKEIATGRATQPAPRAVARRDRTPNTAPHPAGRAVDSIADPSIIRTGIASDKREAPAPSQVAIEQPSVPQQPEAKTDSSVARIDDDATRAADGVTAIGNLFKQAFAAQQRSRSTLGAAGDIERLPPLDAMEMPAARGIAPPRVRGYDLLFQLKYGEHPFVSPGVAPQLATAAVPLVMATDTYDLALRSARLGQVLSGDEVRVEDFLAAQEYALPPAPAGALALHAAGSKSPTGESGLHLMQLAVQAGSLRPQPYPPTRLIVVTDASSAMRGSARWEAVQRALASLALRMKPADRVTLLSFAEEPRLLAENATGDQLRALVLDGLSAPRGAADLMAAIQSACQAVQEVRSKETQRLVFLTAGSEDFDDAALEQAGKTLSSLAEAKVGWHVIHLSTGNRDTKLAELAKQGGGTHANAGSSSELYAALLEKLTGASTAVAVKVRLQVKFDPQVVTGYRLLGHASPTVTGPTADLLEIDLSADQVATAMFEMWVKPNGGDQLAMAELTWRDAAGDRAGSKLLPIRRANVSGGFSQAPGWYQQGVIAAKTAELMRGSFFVPANRPLAQLRDLAGQVDSHVAHQPDFKALLGLVELMEKAPSR